MYRSSLARCFGTVTTVMVGILLGATRVEAQKTTDESLRRAAAEVLPRVEALSGLEAKRPINIAARTRKQLENYLSSEASEIDPTMAAAVGAAYAKLGLLPVASGVLDGTSALLGEQLAGYYDAERDTLYVLTDLNRDEAIGVLAHEMVHALQNQYVPLDSLVGSWLGNDRRLAARAAIEGHATVVKWLFSAEQVTGEPAALSDLPDMTLVPLELLFPDDPGPILETAPALVRDGLVFPYSRGAGFVQALWRSNRAFLPFAENLPQSTEQILDPGAKFLTSREAPVEVIFSEEQLPPITPELAGSGAAPKVDPASWWTVYENTLGQFELSILLKERHYQYGAEKYALGWAGDRYLLLRDHEHDVLVWYLAWDDRRSATAFATAFRQIFGPKLNRTGAVEELTIEGRPVVRIIDAEEGVDLSRVPRPEVRLAAARN
jgi:hypothetical protein